MKNRHKNTGYALIGTTMFLLMIMIMWLGVTRQMGTYLRVEKHFQSQRLYNCTVPRALYWAIALLEKNKPATNPYSCRMQVGTEDNPQMYVATFEEIPADSNNYTITVRPAGSGDESLPQVTADTLL